MSARRSSDVTPRSRPRRRGFIIVAVLICVGIGALVAASVLANARVITQRARLIEDSVEARLAITAAQHACQQLLLEQRDRLLQGEPPELPDRIVLFERDGYRAVARLLPVRGELVRPTAARLDVNAAPDDQIRALEAAGVEAAAIEAILAARAKRQILALDELIDNNAITPETLYGDLDEFIESLTGAAAAVPDRAEPMNAPGERTLAELLAVYSADPNVQIALDPNRPDAFGRNRVNLNRPFSDEMAEAIRNEFDENVVNVVRGLIVGQGIRFTDDGVIIRTFVQFGVDPADWAGILDAICTSPDPYLRSRIDLNAAPAEVIAALPGLSDDIAQRIVAQREALTADEKRSPTWVAAQSLVEPTEYVAIAGYVTSRSLQFELLVETGYEPIEPTGQGALFAGGGAGVGGSGPDESPLRARRVTELTIDLAAPRPRLATIRDVTHMSMAVGLWRAAREAAERTPVIERMSIDDWEPEDADQLAEGDDGWDEPRSAFDIPDISMNPGSGTSLATETRFGEASHIPGDSGPESGFGSADSPEAVDRRMGRWKVSPPSGRGGSGVAPRTEQ
jgi:DNA uptake protein ComE-like DNA-binding protein